MLVSESVGCVVGWSLWFQSQLWSGPSSRGPATEGLGVSRVEAGGHELIFYW